MGLDRYAVAGDYPIRFKPQAPGAALDYTLDFQALALAAFPVLLLGVSWSVVANPGDGKPLAIVSQLMAAGLSVVRLSGGTPLSEYTLRAQCSWSDGETSVVSFVLPIAFMPNASTLFPASIASAELFGVPTIH